MNDDILLIKPKRAKGEDGYKVFSIRVKEELVEKIDSLSTETGRSRNELIGLFIDYALERCQVDKSG